MSRQVATLNACSCWWRWRCFIFCFLLLFFIHLGLRFFLCSSLSAHICASNICVVHHIYSLFSVMIYSAQPVQKYIPNKLKSYENTPVTSKAEIFLWFLPFFWYWFLLHLLQSYFRVFILISVIFFFRRAIVSDNGRYMWFSSVIRMASFVWSICIFHCVHYSSNMMCKRALRLILMVGGAGVIFRRYWHRRRYLNSSSDNEMTRSRKLCSDIQQKFQFNNAIVFHYAYDLIDNTMATLCQLHVSMSSNAFQRLLLY